MRGAANKGAKVKTIILNDLKITPCQHCDACLKKGKCRIDDDMQMVYRELEQADRVVIASPIHFMTVSAQTKAMIDRCQALWARKYILKVPPLGTSQREKKGLFVSVGGRNVANLFEPALVTVRALFNTLNIRYAGALVFPGVDEKGVITEYPDALQQAFVAGQKLVDNTPTE